MATYENTDRGDALPYRLRRAEEAVERLVSWRGRVDTTMAKREEQYKNMEEKVDGLVRTVDSLRKDILGFALSIAGSAIVFSLSVLIATGKIGG